MNEILYTCYNIYIIINIKLKEIRSLIRNVYMHVFWKIQKVKYFYKSKKH